jgi:rare lipoprotein A
MFISSRRTRAFLPLGLVAALSFALPAQSSGQQMPTLDDAFEEYNSDPTAYQPAPDAVDLDSFKPKRQVKPKPKPKPKPETDSRSVSRGPTGKGRVVRSLGNGVASFYGKRFHGRLTANGERFNMNAMTAAHKTLKFGTKVKVTYLRNGRSVVVRINDRGPFIKGRHIDLSRRAAERLGMISSGHGRVRMEIVR